MNIYLADNIKKLRRAKNLTQETLADFIGISFQAVSKWECGDAYPDITLLPVIANYFEVTIDELLGNDKAKSEEKIQSYLDEYMQLWMRLDDESIAKKHALIKQAYREYPYDWRIIDKFCDSFVYGHLGDEANFEKNKTLVRKLCAIIFDDCTDDIIRRNAVTYMIRLSDGAEEEEWLKKVTDRLSRGDEREWNHLSKGRKEEAFAVYQQNLMDHFQRDLMWRFDCYCQNYGDIVTAADKIAVLKISESLIDALYAGEESMLGSKALIYSDIARVYFAGGDNENGYAYLEKIAEAKEKQLSSTKPDGAPYNSPLFNRLKVEKVRGNGGMDIYIDDMNNSKEYDSVRSEARFINCMKRLEALL
jgi:Predicted transcriptional regulators